MGGMEFNKIFAAILVAGIIAMFCGFVAGILMPDHNLEENAYPIEVPDQPVAGAPQVEEKPEPILAMIAEADLERGERVSRACSACHTFDEGGANGVGPNLYGVVGGPKDHVEDYNYSGALLEHGGERWTMAELNKYLWKPKEYAPGTKMNFIGLKKPEDRAALLAWLRQKDDAPVDLPTAEEIAAEKEELAPPAPETADSEGEGEVETDSADMADEPVTPDQEADEVLEEEVPANAVNPAVN